MSINLIAILLSLAMMLTGAGSQGAPEEVSRTLLVHNVALTYNGETVRLAPELRLGSSTDGEKALFDFGIGLDGQTLMPMQLAAGQDGITALFAESGVCAKVTAKALEQAAEQLTGMSEAMIAGDEQSAELMQFITQEYIPAYTGLLAMAADKDRMAEMQAKSEEIMDSVMDRGEGTPGVAVIDDVEYNVNTYEYTMDTTKLGELVDALTAASPELSAYWDATMKLYQMLPVDMGMEGVESYSQMLETFGIDMTIDMAEQRSDDGEVQIVDAVMTMDLNGMMAIMQERMQQAEEALEDAEQGDETVEDAVEEVEEAVEELPVLEPIVMDIHSMKVGDAANANVSGSYEIEGQGAMDFAVQATQETDSSTMDMTMEFSQDGEKLARYGMSFAQAEDDEGGTTYGANCGVVVKDEAQVDIYVYGESAADGTSANTFSVDGKLPESVFSLSMDIDVLNDAIEDLTGGVEPTVVIDDLSEEALNALGQDQNLIGALMKVSGSLTMDAGKLTQDESVKNLGLLLQGERLPIVVDDEPVEDYDYTYEMMDGDGDFVIEGLDSDGEGDYEPVEDDGELGFEVPEFTWLPEGWSVSATETDTAYDWAGVSVVDESGAEVLNVTYFEDMDGSQANYIVADDGSIEEGRAINVIDYGEAGLSVTLRENGLYGNLNFASEDVDVETIGRIVAGIEY